MAIFLLVERFIYAENIHMKILFRKPISLVSLVLLFQVFISSAAVGANGKVLYVTHEPGHWHDYSTQLRIFKEEIASKQSWEVTVITGSYKEVIEKLHNPDFAKGYDAVVYNYCFAESPDLESCANVIKQTRDHGVPAMLIHCSMHSWWDTYKRGQKLDGHKSAKAIPERVAEWKAKHGDAPFPIYGDFTGVASIVHGPKIPITLSKVTNHPASARLPDGYVTPNAELYNNFYLVEGVVPLVEGTQQNNKYIVMWTCPQGASQVLGLTLGHGSEEWGKDVFQNLVADSINYLLENPKP